MAKMLPPEKSSIPMTLYGYYINDTSQRLAGWGGGWIEVGAL
jgi:hypothetical protein